MGERVLCMAEAVEFAHETAKIWLNVALCQLRPKENEACVESAARALDAAPLLRVAPPPGLRAPAQLVRFLHRVLALLPPPSN